MSGHPWSEVDFYLADRLRAGEDPVFAAILAANAAAGLPGIDVSPLQGRFLQLLVRISGARRILEIGTLGGYSAIWMGQGLPVGGQLISLEFDPTHARVARSNVERAALSDRIEIREGAALDLLPGLEGPFDLVFIDADKRNNAAYVDWSIRLGRPGTVIVLDNVVREGAVVSEESRDSAVLGSRAALDFLHSDQRIDSTALQTVGVKGWDGFVLARVRSV
jgi:predicted O-methyltransferase YrrM